MHKIWTKEQTDFLLKNYETLKTKELLAVLTDKTNDQLRWKAKALGVSKKVGRSASDMSFLLNFDDPETCYWWGFITADGCINNRSIILAVHEKDKDHLIKFCKKSNSNISQSTRINPWHKTPYTMVRTAIEDKFILPKIKDILKLKPKKTYNPFDLSIFLTPERLNSFLAGLIDGDGYIGKNSISIKIHPNWRDTLILISDKIREFYGIHSLVRVIKEGWVIFTIGKKDDQKKLFEMIKHLPKLERKWEKFIIQPSS